MQIQRVNNQQSFTATFSYEKAVPKRAQEFVGSKKCVLVENFIEDKLYLEASSVIEKLKTWLANNKLKRVFGVKPAEKLDPEVYKEPIAVEMGEDLVVLEESLVPTNHRSPSIIRVLLGKDASDGTVTIRRDVHGDYSKREEVYKEDKSFDELAGLIRAVK